MAAAVTAIAAAAAKPKVAVQMTKRAKRRSGLKRRRNGEEKRSRAREAMIVMPIMPSRGPPRATLVADAMTTAAPPGLCLRSSGSLPSMNISWAIFSLW